MAKLERQQNVLNLLSNLRGLEPLKQLFWSELNYQRVNEPLSRRGWPEPAMKALADDPVLFAGGGEDEAFHVIYCRLASNVLARGFERPVVTQMLREHPYALFVFSNKGQTDWHFLNVKFDDKVERRRLFRRITIRPDAGLRTATERIQLLDLAEINPELFGITPLAIQQRCDAAFDVETVTKDFFREIANWYFWALKNVSFPKDAPKEKDGHDHISVIRLITRLIFCWFVKEKGLIPGDIFDEKNLARMLEGFAPQKTGDKESVFYKAILQNLFFATLNTEMDKRGWAKEEQNFMAHTLYRFRDFFREPKAALDLFKDIPFLNGGLFECLDKDLGESASPRYLRIDGFSRRADSQPTVPDFLFFGAARAVDLSGDYGDNKFRSVPVRGLIHIFNHYNFTIEENTPIEEEVALDPELSGKVFENLLAAYNPETGASARKQTGSFYTPREIVNYMVDEALIAYLKGKLEAAFTDAKDAEARLRHLFAYNDEPHQFSTREVDALIDAIDNLKTLDPSVGSGAFPMGMLHKLVFILGKLDPRNEKWKERQIQRVRDAIAIAEKIDDSTLREKSVRDLEQQIDGVKEAFDRNELDYGRKLFLIENCIYGVDIQPIAVQIAKMRFFISLIVDQKTDRTAQNLGVRPLPNLETKFVAANTLIGVTRPGQQLLRNREIDAKEAELRRVRERHFNARTPASKAKYREQDKKLRAEIAELLKGDGWDTATSHKLASWDPYDQNDSADFFDPEWMFGLIPHGAIKSAKTTLRGSLGLINEVKGQTELVAAEKPEGCFDIIIGNPPYINIENISEADRGIYLQIYGDGGKLGKRYDVYQLFMMRGVLLNAARGTLAYILPNTFLMGSSYLILRRRLCLLTSVSAVVDLPQNVFESATVDNVLIFMRRGREKNNQIQISKLSTDSSISKIAARDWDDAFAIPQDGLIEGNEFKLNVHMNPVLQLLFGKIAVGSVRLGDVTESSQGIIIYRTEEDATLNKYTSFQNHKGWKKLLRGKNIGYYCTKWAGEYIHYGDWLWCSRDEKYFSRPKLLLHAMRNKSLKRRLVATYDEDAHYNAHNLANIISKKDSGFDLKFILAVFNSTLINLWYRNHFPNVNINPNDFRQIPVRIATPTRQSALIALVEKILAAKQNNPAADTTALERAIDKQVYDLYGLTPQDIQLVEESMQEIG